MIYCHCNCYLFVVTLMEFLKSRSIIILCLVIYDPLGKIIYNQSESWQRDLKYPNFYMKCIETKIGGKFFYKCNPDTLGGQNFSSPRKTCHNWQFPPPAFQFSYNLVWNVLQLPSFNMSSRWNGHKRDNLKRLSDDKIAYLSPLTTQVVC